MSQNFNKGIVDHFPDIMNTVHRVDDIQQLVDDALSNAKENGYTFDNMTTPEIAVDLMTYCSELENKPYSKVLFHIALNRLKLRQRKLLAANNGQ